MFQDKPEKLKEQRSHKVALNNALFKLSQQHRILSPLKEDLDKLENDESRALKLKPWKINEYKDVKLDPNSLIFLIETKDPNKLVQFLVEQEGFEQALESIKERSKYQVEEIKSSLEITDIANEELYYRVLSESIGKQKLENLKYLKDQVYFHIYESHKSVEKTFSEFRVYAKTLFSKANFINIDKST